MSVTSVEEMNGGPRGSCESDGAPLLFLSYCTPKGDNNNNNNNNVDDDEKKSL